MNSHLNLYRKFFSLSVLFTFCLSLSAINVSETSNNNNIKGELKKQLLPEPIYDANPKYVDLYWKAWEIAWTRLKYQDGVFQSPYMDEALWDNTIWIWDTEFMVMFCRYAPHVFAGIESLNNFYEPILNKKETSLRIQHPDNPPFYSWVEYEYYKMTGDRKHIEKLIKENRFPQRHYYWFDSLTRGTKLHFDHAWIAAEKKDKGYYWGWVASGLDNTPRGRNRKSEMLWMDAVAQQAVSAMYISKLAEEVNDKETKKEFDNLYKKNIDLLNQYYWDEADGFYYDIEEADNSFIKVRTPTVFWAMLAGAPDKKKAEKLIKYVSDPNEFGGTYPWPSLSRRDQEYNHEIGDYWKGGVWLPLAYMATKAIEKYGYYDLAYEHSCNLLNQMYDTYTSYTPNTIWECYAPSAARPSERQRKDHRELVTPDFCGWSALGPISMFIENVIGFNNIDANKKIIEWNKRGESRQGIKNLRFGDVITDIIYEGGEIKTKSTGNYTLVVNGKSFKIKGGDNVFKFKK